MASDLDIRYPVGRFNFSDPFRSEDRPLLLAQLAEAPSKLRAAVAGLSEVQLDTPYRPGGWTVRQVVHHLADAQVNWYIRPKLAVTEDVPTTKPYAEQLWAELADARYGPIEPSLRIFEGVTARWCRFLDSLGPAEWFRKFTNPEWGTLTVEDTLRGMAWHAHHHTAHITELRKREAGKRNNWRFGALREGPETVERGVLCDPLRGRLLVAQSRILVIAEPRGNRPAHSGHRVQQH